MERIEYFDKYIAPDLPDFVKQGLELFRSRHGLFLTIHAMSSRWYMPDGSFLFSNCMAHHADYCMRKRYGNRKYNKLCLHDCAARVEQVSLRSGEPFLHHCWKGVTELIVPFVWDGVLELIFYVGPFRGPEVPAKEEFRTEWSALPEFPGEKRNRLIQECLLLGTAFYARLMQENRKESHASGRKEMIREYILRYGCGGITLSDLAAHLGVSVSRASHLCVELLGVPFQELVLNVRMKKAQFLLRETEEPMKEIAVKAGFSNVYYFSRMFRRFFGETPGRFRSSGRTG